MSRPTKPIGTPCHCPDCGAEFSYDGRRRCSACHRKYERFQTMTKRQRQRHEPRQWILLHPESLDYSLYEIAITIGTSTKNAHDILIRAMGKFRSTFIKMYPNGY